MRFGPAANGAPDGLPAPTVPCQASLPGSSFGLQAHQLALAEPVPLVGKSLIERGRRSSSKPSAGPLLGEKVRQALVDDVDHVGWVPGAHGPPDARPATVGVALPRVYVDDPLSSS